MQDLTLFFLFFLPRQTIYGTKFPIARGGPIQSSDSNLLSALVCSGQSQAKKVALTACMRKLLTILNAMLKHRTPWREVETHHA